MAILIVLLVLSFLVIIHELGHYFAARKAGITVEEFGIGYPPRALNFSLLAKRFNITKYFSFWRRFDSSKTELTLNWIPFGGFVRMAGETPNPKQNATPQPGDFLAATLAQRLMVIFAGVAVNFLFGVVAFTIVFSKTGIPQEISGARIGTVEPNSPAAQAGVPNQVQIIGFQTDNGLVETKTVESVKSFVEENRGETVTLITTGICQQLICEDRQEYSVYLRTADETPENQGSLGISFETVIFQSYPWYEMPFRSAWHGSVQALQLSKMILDALSGVGQDLFRGKVSSDVAGPVGIVYQAQKGQFFDQGWLSILTFAGILSINLAIMNILPFPPLDGGRAVLSILELLIGKNKSHLIEYYANYGGYVFLLALVVLITFSDISRIIMGG